MDILWVRLRSLGDLLLTLPALGFLRRRMPATRITLVVHSRFAGLFRGHPWIAEVVTADRGLRGYGTVLTRRAPWLRRRYQAVVNGHGGRFSAWITARAQAPMKIGFSRYPFASVYTHRVALSPSDYYSSHTAALQARLIGPFLGEPPAGADLPPAYLPPRSPAVPLDPGLRDFIRGRPFVLFHPGGRYRSKRWPTRRSVNLLQSWAERRPDCAFGCFIGPEETRDPALRTLPPSLYPVRGLDLVETAELLRRTRLYIGFDTGIMHLAAAVGTPMIIVWGASFPVLWAPWKSPYLRLSARDAACNGCRDKTCPATRPAPCIDAIPDDLLTACMESWLAMRESPAPTLPETKA